jgi:hypothetical protein
MDDVAVTSFTNQAVASIEDAEAEASFTVNLNAQPELGLSQSVYPNSYDEPGD